MKKNIGKTCKNCIHWHDTGKTQEVQFRFIPAVVFNTGLCTDGSYTTEKYLCGRFLLRIQKSTFKLT